MIVPMKKVTLLALAREERNALEILRDIGVMQIVPSEQRSTASQNSADLLAAARRVMQQLDSMRPEDADPVSSGDAARGREVIGNAGKLFERKLELEMEISTLKQRIERLNVWGDFKRGTLDELRAKGINVILCSGTREEFEQAKIQEALRVFPINETRSTVDFAAVVTAEVSPEIIAELPEFRLADDDDPAALRRRCITATQQLKKCGDELVKLSLETGAMKRFCAELSDAAEFDRASDAMREYGEISVLCGFVPEPELEAVRNAARQHGWGLLIADPAADEEACEARISR